MNLIELLKKYTEKSGGVSAQDEGVLRQAQSLFDLFRQYTQPKLNPIQQQPLQQQNPFWLQQSSQPVVRMPDQAVQIGGDSSFYLNQPRETYAPSVPLVQQQMPQAPIVAKPILFPQPVVQAQPTPVVQAPPSGLAQLQAPAPQKLGSYQPSLPSKGSAGRGRIMQYAEGGAVEIDEFQTDEPEQTSSDFMQQLLQKYVDEPSPYAAEIATARDRSSKQQQQLEALIRQSGENKAPGPSKAEMYFNLAAAFGTPGKTGSFFEQAGNAGKVLAEDRKAGREIEAANQARALGAALEGTKLGLSGTKEDLATLRLLEGQEQGTRRQLLLEEARRRRASETPSSEAGKVARDAGLKPGTPEYADFVRNYSERKIESANAYRDVMAQVAGGNLDLRRRQVDTAESAAAKLTPAELKLKDEAQDAMDSARNAYSSLMQALTLSDTAYAGSAVDKAKRIALGAIGSSDPRLAATEQLESALRRVDLDSLRATFGGNPTEGERAALSALSGLAAATPETRKKLIQAAIAGLKRGYSQRKTRLAEITSGKYRTTEVAEPKYGDLPEETDITMEDLGAPN